jgi:hypothetical protein
MRVEVIRVGRAEVSPIGVGRGLALVEAVVAIASPLDPSRDRGVRLKIRAMRMEQRVTDS